MFCTRNYSSLLRINQRKFILSVNSKSFSRYFRNSKNNFYSSTTLTFSRLASISLISTIPIKALDEFTDKPKVTKRIRSLTDSTDLTLTLYQYQSCPFCCKIRAYLDYKGLSYDVIEVNSLRRNEIKWSEYKKVPILTCSSSKDKSLVQFNDSSLIISALESYLINKNQKLLEIAECYPSIETKNSKGKNVLDFPNKYFIMYNNRKIPPDSDDVRKWRQWTDDILVHTISPNIYRTLSEAMETFKYFSEVGEWGKNFGDFETKMITVSAAIAMYFVGKLLKKRHNLTDDVRISMYNAVRESMTELKNRKTIFFGGNQPNLVDLSIYGVLNSVEGTKAFSDVQTNVKGFKEWYGAVNTVIGKNMGVVMKTDLNLSIAS